MNALDLSTLKFFDVASDMVYIVFRQFSLIPAFLNNSLEDLVNMIPPVISSLLQNVANLLEAGLNSLIDAVGGTGNLDFNVPTFSVSSIALNILDSVATVLGIPNIEDMTLFAFILGAGGTIITLCVVGRWFYKLFD